MEEIEVEIDERYAVLSKLPVEKDGEIVEKTCLRKKFKKGVWRDNFVILFNEGFPRGELKEFVNNGYG